MPQAATFFRSVNDRMHDLQEDWIHSGLQADYDFVCECDDDGCARRMQLTDEEYAALRADARQFAVAPGCERLGIEEVVARNERYVLVRKRAAAA
jgi:hypothetical protein